MKKMIFIALVALLVVAGCASSTPPLTIGPAQLTVTNYSNFDINEVYFNGTYFGRIVTGNSVTQSITSGEHNVYIQGDGFWLKCLPVLRINSGDYTTFTITDHTQGTVVPAPGASSTKSSSIQKLKDMEIK